MNFQSYHEWPEVYNSSTWDDPLKYRLCIYFFEIHRTVSTKMPYLDDVAHDTWEYLTDFDCTEPQYRTPEYSLYLRQLMLRINKQSYLLIDLLLEDSIIRELLCTLSRMYHPPGLLYIPCSDHIFHCIDLFSPVGTERRISPFFISECILVETFFRIYHFFNYPFIQYNDEDVPFDQDRMDIYWAYTDSDLPEPRWYSRPDNENWDSDSLTEDDIPSYELSNLCLFTKVG